MEIVEEMKDIISDRTDEMTDRLQEFYLNEEEDNEKVLPEIIVIVLELVAKAIEDENYTEVDGDEGIVQAISYLYTLYPTTLGASFALTINQNQIPEAISKTEEFLFKDETANVTLRRIALEFIRIYALVEAKLYLKLNEYEAAIYYLDKAYKAGSIEAGIILKNIYTEGTIVPENIEKAYDYYDGVMYFKDNQFLDLENDEKLVRLLTDTNRK